MLVSVLVVTSVSLIVILGLASTINEHLARGGTLLLSGKSYALAESGIEDLAYRIKRNYASNATEVISLDGNSTEVEVVDIVGGKQLISTATCGSFVRKAKAIMTTGIGAIFNYGIQTGQGGFIMGNATVNGSVYSGGNITGSNNATITGAAVASNPPTASPDQTNITPTPPTNSINFADGASTQDFAQSFVLSSSGKNSLVQLYIKKVGDPSSATVRIVSNSGGSPGTASLTTGTLNSNFVTTTYGLVDIVFSSNVNLTSGITYWIVVDSPTDSASNYYTIGANSSYTSGLANIGAFGGSWGDTSPAGLDGYFTIYLEGAPAVIDNIDIGTAGVGDAWAHAVNNSKVNGSLYCQTGSGNTDENSNALSCSVAVDPVSQNMPVSESNIEQWKNDAVTDGEVTCSGGNYTPATGASLGPKKIPCNLVIDNNFTLTGILWVTGNVTTSNGRTVTLASSFGTRSSVIVVEGTTAISNNSLFNGTGQTGSYIMILSTNTGTSPAAIDVGNNAGTVILNAQKGTIHFNNNSGAKEATARLIDMDNGSTVTYDSGLVNTIFSSGPSGGYVFGSWKEVE